MAYKLSLIIFMAVIAVGLALTTTMATTREPKVTTTEKSIVDNSMESFDRRDKRQLVSPYLILSFLRFLIFYNGRNKL